MMMMRSRGFTLLVPLAALSLTGWLTRPLVAPAWAAVRPIESALQLQSLEGRLGQGLTFALFGGFRAVIADFLWLETNTHWEDQDLPGTQKMIDLVTTVDPRPLYFWINGARMIAYDMPHWRFQQWEGPDPLPDEVRRRIEEEQNQAALQFLDRALAAHPSEPLLLIEIANIHYRRRHDLATAADFYRAAAQQPGAPFYAARIHAVLLEEQGRLQEAYDWLRNLYPTLPATNPMANAELVLQRIQKLEEVLGIPEGKHFSPAAPGENAATPASPKSP